LTAPDGYTLLHYTKFVTGLWRRKAFCTLLQLDMPLAQKCIPDAVGNLNSVGQSPAAHSLQEESN
jgi:hypothetical protein